MNPLGGRNLFFSFSSNPKLLMGIKIRKNIMYNAIDYPIELAHHNRKIIHSPKYPHPGFKNLHIENIVYSCFLDLVPNKRMLTDELKTKLSEINNYSFNIISTDAYNYCAQKKNFPAVYVIVGMFNVKKYIISTILSICKQNYTDFEIVIVDDGSTDGGDLDVLKFMNKYSCMYSIKFTSIPHIGNPGLTRNIALYNLVNYPSIVAFMDGDDKYANSNSLRNLVRPLIDSPELFAVYGGYSIISEDDEKLSGPRMFKKKSDNSWEWKKKYLLNWENILSFSLPPFHIQCLALSKNIPFFEYMPIGEDARFYACLFRLSAKQNNGELSGIKQIPHVIAKYRKRKTSITSYNRVEKYKPIPQINVEEKLCYNKLPTIWKIAGLPVKYINIDNLSLFRQGIWLKTIFRALQGMHFRKALQMIKDTRQDRLLNSNKLLVAFMKDLFDSKHIWMMALRLFMKKSKGSILSKRD